MVNEHPEEGPYGQGGEGAWGAGELTWRYRHRACYAHRDLVYRVLQSVHQREDLRALQVSFLEESCDLLVAQRGYRACAVVVCDRGGDSSLRGATGQEAAYKDFLRLFEGPAKPPCAGVFYSEKDRAPEVTIDECCKACSSSRLCRSPSTVVKKLRAGEGRTGVLRVSLPAQWHYDPGEDAFLRHILHGLELVLGHAQGQEKHREVTKALKESEARYRVIFEGAADPIFCVGPDGRFQAANRVAAQAMGVRVEQLVGKHMYDLFPREEAERQLRNIMRVYETGRPFVEDEAPTVVRGQTRWYNTTLTPIRGPGGSIYTVVGVCRDVTEFRKARLEKAQLEEQLRHAQKMEAIGRLAGGVAHDFNNLLVAILGYSELLKAQLPAESGAYRQAQEIARAAERAASLTRRLLAFSRRQVLSCELCDLNELVRENQGLIVRLFGDDITVTTELAAGVPPVEADVTQLVQILLNLAVNARDAMPEGGSLRIQTSTTVVDERSSTGTLPLGEGRYACLTVSDTGCGMDDHTVSRIFEPFFTTKDPGVGTGLGLSVVYGIVQQHKGHIEVESEVGAGSTFRIYLPAATGRAQRNAAEKGGAVTGVRGGETILICEDEEAVLRFLAEGLRTLGYTVLAARSAQQALEILTERGGQVEVLLTDVLMPEMGGVALAEEARRIRPQLKVVYISGHTENGIPVAELQRGTVTFLQKPCKAEDVAAAIRKLVGKRGRR